MIARIANPITVTLLRETVTSRDQYGNDVTTATEVPVEGCASWPAGTAEAQGVGDTVTTARILLLPDGTEVTAVDRVRLPDESVWRVQGDPEQRGGNLTVTRGGVTVALQRITG